MILIERKQTDPFFNIAAEEYILKNFSEDIIMLWQSAPSVIVGKHQNTLTEVNKLFLETNNIPVIRRISGGGTVYHDPGNINFTLITSEKGKDKLIDFRRFTEPIIAFLYTLGLKASFEGKNNLIVSGKKISGNSAHVFKNRVMHHGTLLFNCDLDILNAAIHPLKMNIEDKAVQSIRATVTNIKNHLKTDLTIEQFGEKLQKYLMDWYQIRQFEKLSALDIRRIHQLIEERYRRWDWNYGYSPKYTFNNELDGKTARLEVKNGLIEKAIIEPETDIAKQIVGCRHQQKDLAAKMKSLNIDEDKVTQTLRLLGY